MSEPTLYPTIQFVTQHHHMAERAGHIQSAPWLRMTFPGLNAEELEALGDHLGDKLGWFTWFHEMPDTPAQEGAG